MHILATGVKHIVAVPLVQKPVESKQALNEFAEQHGVAVPEPVGLGAMLGGLILLRRRGR